MSYRDTRPTLFARAERLERELAAARRRLSKRARPRIPIFVAGVLLGASLAGLALTRPSTIVEGGGNEGSAPPMTPANAFAHASVGATAEAPKPEQGAAHLFTGHVTVATGEAHVKTGDGCVVKVVEGSPYCIISAVCDGYMPFGGSFSSCRFDEHGAPHAGVHHGTNFPDFFLQDGVLEHGDYRPGHESVIRIELDLGSAPAALPTDLIERHEP